jgi:tetratricopeptide (TPR) repeat protein
MSPRLAHRLTAIALLLSSAELAAQTARRPATPEKQAPELTAALPDLAEVPAPVVDVFEPAVARQLAEARATTERLIAQRSSESRAAFGTLCLLYLRYELFDAAEPCLRKARSLEPDQFRWPYYQTFVYTRAADLSRAGESVAAALALEPRDVPALLRAGDLHLLAHDAAKAETVFAAALAADSSSDAARFGLGRVAAMRGDHAAAAAQFEKALAGQPEGSIVHYHLGMAYRALGQLDRAREELAKSRRWRSSSTIL